ncbi:hypothetical protein EUX98_g1155 [Antrodiella citrinella]|uniref:Uncharacterized protein n=1 Tax=Antrodiella citrinella TaxID=2447956 RepID=A0A4S4N5D4_9APHY|nr:hypothetical protein EUX98_g1155 [Antrodiella citrinella]
MRRKTFGLLNKVAKANSHSIAYQLLAVAISVENTGDPNILETFVRTIYRHAVTDQTRTRLYVDVCLRAQYEFDRIVASGEPEELRTFMTFVGGLLAEGPLAWNDVDSMMDVLYQHVACSDEGATSALYQFLSRVMVSHNAIRLLTDLDILRRTQEALSAQAGELRPKVHYILLNIADQVTYPRPADVFGSASHRNDVYGLDASATASVASFTVETQDDAAFRQWHASQLEPQVREFIVTRNDTVALEHLRNLHSEQRPVFISLLVSMALATGDMTCAQSVAALFLSEDVRGLCDVEMFERAFEAELSSLEDTIIDIPYATQLLAVMLQGSPLPRATVENLALASSHSRHDQRRDTLAVTEGLLDTYAALIQSPGSRSGVASSTASVEDLHHPGHAPSESGMSSFGYAL